MKRISLLLVTMLLSGFMFGQFHIGPQIGFTASKLSLNSSDISSSLKSNFMFGAMARIGEKIYIEPEVNWMTTGSVFRYPSASLDGVNLSPVEQNIKVKSIQIPVSVGWRIIDLKLANIRVFVGASANIVTDKTINNTDDDNSIGKDLINPITDADINDMAWQYHVGAGVDLLMFALDLKYEGDFNSLIHGDVKYNSSTHELSSNTNLFVVSLAWKIF